MRLALLFPFALVACKGGATIPDDSDVAGDTDAVDTTDADTDADSDADTDADTDADSDADTDADTEVACTRLIVTDIDETLTTDDLEFIYQIANPSHDPEMRPDADAMMRAYADKGYKVMYITGRGDQVQLLDGTSAFDATNDWLNAHGFPRSDGDLFLYSGISATGDTARVYKGGVIADLLADPTVTVAECYGNATADIDACLDNGIDPADSWLVGDLANDMTDQGVNPLSNDDAYTAHLADFVPGVPDAACP
jgi:hypothetical protein